VEHVSKDLAKRQTVVISQPMYFPWVGLLEQVRLADTFVHYNDVQYARGFFNRVQVKTPQGVRWLSVPLRELHRGQLINEVRIDERVDWRSQHRDILRQAYLHSPFLQDMLRVFDSAMTRPADSLADVSRASIMALATYFDLEEGRIFLNSEELGVPGSSTQRLLDLTRRVQGHIYVTGHGARNYLEHELFEQAGVEVRYMHYRSIPYPQQHGPFTPYVTGLDLVANTGKDGRNLISPETLNWKEFTQ
jgi:hypothetical protein